MVCACRIELLFPLVDIHEGLAMKRAIAMTELVLILLAAFAGIGLIVLSKKGAEKQDCKGSIEMCRTSYQLIKQVTQKLWLYPRVNCPAISLPNCQQRKLETDSKEQTLFTIAENLRWCWYKTNGNENTMGEDFAKCWGIPGCDINFCLVCSEFETKVDLSRQEIEDYLNTKAMPGEAIRYGQYLTPTSVDWPAGSGRSYLTSIAKGKTYYVVSVSAETEGDKRVYLYIGQPPMYCGTDTTKAVRNYDRA